MPSTDTIAAVATAVAPGQGGIAVIRLSGPAAEATGRSVVHCPGRQEWGSHRVVYGHVIDGEGRRLDEVLLLLMRGPRSFTGEDVVEIHCHGGVIAVQRVLEQVLRQPGVRRAQPGEFSQRAVLNGRLDLTRAEAVKLRGPRISRSSTSSRRRPLPSITWPYTTRCDPHSCRPGQCTTLRPVASAAGPERRITAMPPCPGATAVATAAIVSVLGTAVAAGDPYLGSCLLYTSDAADE